MKVLIITNSYPDNSESYRGIFIRKLAYELLQQGLEVVVLTPRVLHSSPYLENDQGIKVYRFWYPSGDKPLGQSGAIPLLPMAVYMVSGLYKAIATIMRERPDVIHGNWIVPTGLIAALAGQLLRIPVVNTAHGMDVRISARKPVGLLFDLAIRLSQKVTVVSDMMKNKPSLRDAETIPCGVDESFFAVTPDRNANHVISTRSLEPIYDVETLIRAVPLVLQEIPDARFTIIGDGSQADMLKNLAAELRVSSHIDFTGRVENSAIPEYMRRAKVYVSTSLADGTSVSLLEAMAAGLIPVVSDIEANRPWIKHGRDGHTFQPCNIHDLACCIIQGLSGIIEYTLFDLKRAELEDTIRWSSIASRYRGIFQESIET